MNSGTLFVVATPIGNLDDASTRSIEVLRAADIIACEDTRTSATLLAHYGIAVRTVALHEHNERAAAAGLLEALRRGSNVALISDAGTPTLSDPGAHFVAQAHQAGIRVSPVPGASAAAAAFSASGFVSGGFLFAGFLPASGSARTRAIETLDVPWPVVLYEAPHRISKTIAQLAARLGAAREVLIGRELTKKFEEIARLPLGEAGTWLAAGPHRTQGEFVIVLAAGEPRDPLEDQADRVLDLLLAEVSPSIAAKVAARITGMPKKDLYRKALARAK